MATKFSKIQIKISAIVVVLCFVAFVASNSLNFVSTAETDPIIDELASYKTWTRINKKPIAVKLLLADHKEIDDKRSFIVEEVPTFSIDGAGG